MAFYAFFRLKNFTNIFCFLFFLFVYKFNKNYLLIIFLIFSAEGDINDVLIKTLAEAHANTNLKLDIVNEMFRKSQVSKGKSLIFFLKFFVHFYNFFN